MNKEEIMNHPEFIKINELPPKDRHSYMNRMRASFESLFLCDIDVRTLPVAVKEHESRAYICTGKSITETTHIWIFKPKQAGIREEKVNELLNIMIKKDPVLYEKILDTPVFAYAFNELANLAKKDTI